MSEKYKNIRAAVIHEESQVSFLFADTLKEAKFQLELEDPLVIELLAWLISKHSTLYEGEEGKTVYGGNITPIEGNRSQLALDLVHTLRVGQPDANNLEGVRKIVLDLAQEAERLEYIFCTHEPELIRIALGGSKML